MYGGCRPLARALGTEARAPQVGALCLDTTAYYFQRHGMTLFCPQRERVLDALCLVCLHRTRRKDLLP